MAFATPAAALNDAISETPEASLTIYNQNFAAVRQYVPLQLGPGLNLVHFSDTTAHVETDSVILRDPTGLRKLQILEQSYRADPISEGLLLSLNEGKEVDFEVMDAGVKKIVRGRVIRSDYIPPFDPYTAYSNPYYQQQMAMVNAGGAQPIIELDGKLVFGLPGRPIFSSLGDDTILKPTLDWQLRTDKPGAFNAELAYITCGMSWEADYNLVAGEKGDVLDVIGWVTFNNQSGRSFRNAQIKLMAGDVSKLQSVNGRVEYGIMVSAMNAAVEMSPAIREKSFDEFHLYTLQNPVTLRDRETKQVEFVRATGVKGERLYIYDGVKIEQYNGWNEEMIRQNAEYGTQMNKQVWVMQQFKNSAENGMGLALPKGRLRFYRRDSDGRLEFTGENLIKHTPKDETVRVYTGNSFDLVGERKRTDLKAQYDAHMLDETFEIKLRNHKDEAVEIRVVEHLYRSVNWKILANNFTPVKTDSQTAEFRVMVPANGERVVRYTAHYTW
ncbi:MAG: hypothetical protein HYX26_03430 [Acidobacteriales bacterium]|nr:hypothetical protein [Terriglobales bacterium]